MLTVCVGRHTLLHTRLLDHAAAVVCSQRAPSPGGAVVPAWQCCEHAAETPVLIVRRAWLHTAYPAGDAPPPGRMVRHLQVEKKIDTHSFQKSAHAPTILPSPFPLPTPSTPHSQYPRDGIEK
eukprot:24106-Chlamydomonas_euryale.AAC.7